MKHMIFLFNPRSGRELIRTQLMRILDCFCASGYFPSVYVTQSAGDAERIAREYGKDVELFVVSGGDGTLNQAVSGLMKNKKRPVLGYLPSGSTNDYARSLKIPGDFYEAAEIAVSGEENGVDIGRFGEDRFFVYIAAFGAFTEVSYKTPQDRKNILGHQAYILESVKHLASIKPCSMRVEWEEGTIEGEFIYGMITNTTSVGGFKGLVPMDVSFDDGQFEALFIRTPKTPADLSKIVSYMFLKEEENEYVFRFRTGRVKVTAKTPVPWVLDGEYGGAPQEIVIENIHNAIALRCGGKLPSKPTVNLKETC